MLPAELNVKAESRIAANAAGRLLTSATPARASELTSFHCRYDPGRQSAIPRRRVLYLAHRLPAPPDKGDRIRTYHVLTYLAARHDVWLACFDDEPPSRKGAAALAELRRLCAGLAVVRWAPARAMVRAAAGLMRGCSLSVSAYDSPALRAAVAAWSLDRPFDAAISFSGCMAPYALAALARRRVLDLCDADSAKWRDYARGSRGPWRLLASYEANRLGRDELAWSATADATIVITAREREALRGEASHTAIDRISIIGNGVDVPIDTSPPAASLGPVVAFVGAMDYPPNAGGVTWFLDQVWPLVRHEQPNARLLVVGRRPPRLLRRRHGRAGLTVTGAVPDVGHYLRQARCGIAPLRIARGLPNKVLEMLAWRRPVVVTRAVAACLTGTAASGMRVADEPALFARHVLAMLQDDALCERTAAAGQRHVLARYAWGPRLAAFERLALGAGSHRADFADPV